MNIKEFIESKQAKAQKKLPSTCPLCSVKHGILGFCRGFVTTNPKERTA